MKRFENLTLWLVILGLVLFGAVASVVWVSLGDVGVSEGEVGGFLPDFELPFGDPAPEGESEMVTIDLEDYLLGEALVNLPLIQRLDGLQVSPLVLTVVLGVIFVGGLFAMGLPLALIYVRLDRQAAEVKSDPEYQEAVSELEKREREQLEEIGERQAGGERSEKPSRPSRWGTFFYILLFAFSLGFALGDSLFPNGEVELVGLMLEPAVVGALGLALPTFIIFLLYQYRPRAEIDDSVDGDIGEARIPWGAIWVIVSGLIFLGIGTGLMLAVRSMGG